MKWEWYFIFVIAVLEFGAATGYIWGHEYKNGLFWLGCAFVSCVMLWE
jgi:hypothetical protein